MLKPTKIKMLKWKKKNVSFLVKEKKKKIYVYKKEKKNLFYKIDIKLSIDR